MDQVQVVLSCRDQAGPGGKITVEDSHLEDSLSDTARDSLLDAMRLFASMVSGQYGGRFAVSIETALNGELLDECSASGSLRQAEMYDLQLKMLEANLELLKAQMAKPAEG